MSDTVKLSYKVMEGAFRTIRNSFMNQSDEYFSHFKAIPEFSEKVHVFVPKDLLFMYEISVNLDELLKTMDMNDYDSVEISKESFDQLQKCVTMATKEPVRKWRNNKTSKKPCTNDLLKKQPSLFNG